MSLSKSSRIAWRKFLATEAGIEGLLFMEQQDPVLTAEGDSTKIIFMAGRVQGFKDAIRALPKLVDIAEKETQDEEN